MGRERETVLVLSFLKNCVSRSNFYAQMRPSAAQVPAGGDRKRRPLLHTHTLFYTNEKEVMSKAALCVGDGS